MKKFLEFLKKNDALDNFLDAYPDLDELPPRRYISGSFSWASTEQGFDYWSKLHFKWTSELDF